MTSVRVIVLTGLVALVSGTVPVGSAPSARSLGPVASGSRSGSLPVPGTATAYSAPVAGRPVVLRPFVAPADPYGPGHRGVDLGSRMGDAVLAAADGRVTFAGRVAGRGVVVLAHPDGIRTEYEPVTPIVRQGDEVHRGDVVGTLSGTHPGCASSCLHWGARNSTGYFDPMTLLTRPGPVRLLPWR